MQNYPQELLSPTDMEAMPSGDSEALLLSDTIKLSVLTSGISKQPWEALFRCYWEETLPVKRELVRFFLQTKIELSLGSEMGKGSCYS